MSVSYLHCNSTIISTTVLYSWQLPMIGITLTCSLDLSLLCLSCCFSHSSCLISSYIFMVLELEKTMDLVRSGKKKDFSLLILLKSAGLPLYWMAKLLLFPPILRSNFLVNPMLIFLLNQQHHSSQVILCDLSVSTFNSNHCGCAYFLHVLFCTKS